MDFSMAKEITEQHISLRDRLDAVLRAVGKRQAEASEELRRLQSEYPEMIARHYLGEIGRDELDAVRLRIEGLKVELAEIPIAVQKIKDRQGAGLESFGAASLYLAKWDTRRRYIEARGRLMETGEISDNQAKDFLLLATHAGCSNEAEEIINALVRFATDKRLGIDRPLQFTPRETLLP